MHLFFGGPDYDHLKIILIKLQFNLNSGEICFKYSPNQKILLSIMAILDIIFS